MEAALGWAVPRIERGIEQASPVVQDSLRKAAQYTADGVAAVTPKLQEGLEKLAPRISDAVDEATPHIQDALGKTGPAITSAKDKVVGDYIPRVSGKLGDAGHAVEVALEKSGVSHQVEVAAAKLTGNKKALAKAEKAASEAAKKFAAEMKKAAKKDKKSGKGWLVVGIVVAATAAGVAVWKASKPVADPLEDACPHNPRSRYGPCPRSRGRRRTQDRGEGRRFCGREGKGNRGHCFGEGFTGCAEARFKARI